MTLVEPSIDLYVAWREAHAEWGPGLHEDGFGLEATDDVESVQGFQAWVARVRAGGGTSRWIVEDGRVLGGIGLRHELNERTGHIGYGVRPSARGRGVASWALGAILGEARARGMGRVLVVCLADNPSSARTIERNGGVLEEVRAEVCRYWIELGSPAAGESGVLAEEGADG
ncbi:GNAT family N-acetyltransferase [Kribbella albertanoniae]|uniref:GNAT family N-acetyltransferase n=1 Tax=Kribbella albertanoniae TaxID=1266829 RepID=A0A4R4QFQ0_9ACTN|nr:GNAT family N-acetyltransferase [Kribbella albertanoniae]